MEYIDDLLLPHHDSRWNSYVTSKWICFPTFIFRHFPYLFTLFESKTVNWHGSSTWIDYCVMRNVLGICADFCLLSAGRECDQPIRRNQWYPLLLWMVRISQRNSSINSDNFDIHTTTSHPQRIRKSFVHIGCVQKGRFTRRNLIGIDFNISISFQILNGAFSYFMMIRKMYRWSVNKKG